jgi:uncharacterized protein YegP (UPF0339 family)
MYRFIVFQGQNRQWYWHLLAPNNRIVAASGEGYVNRGDAENGIALVKRWAPLSPVSVR